MNEPMTTQPIHSTTEPDVQNTPEPQMETVEVAAETSDKPSPTTTIKSEPVPFLYRHPKEQMIGGVCGGLGDYFGIDPVLVRILWVVLTLGTAGTGLFAYAALWLLLPVGTVHDGLQAPATLELNERNIGRAGLLLVLFGGLWLLANLGILPALWGIFWQVVQLLFWPILLIGAGLLLLNNQQAWRGRFTRARSKVRARPAISFERISIKDTLLGLQARIPLKRSQENRVAFGVCGGIGRAIGLDANLVRLIWVAFAIGSVGTGVLVYVLAGWLLPDEKPAIEAVYSHEPQGTVIDGTI